MFANIQKLGAHEMNDEKKWYVYLLCDPDTEEPFYVGKGTGDRINQHEKFWRGDYNPVKIQAIKDIHAKGKQVLKKKIAEFDIERDAYIYEWATIHAYRNQLTNVTSGGNGGTQQPRKKQKDEREQPIESLWTAKETAEYLHMPVRTVTRQKGLPFADLGNKVLRFRPEAVRAWVIEREHQLAAS